MHTIYKDKHYIAIKRRWATFTLVVSPPFDRDKIWLFCHVASIFCTTHTFSYIGLPISLFVMNLRNLWLL